MPKWISTPPPDQAGFSLRILRTPASKPIVAFVTATDVLGCITHFARNRTIPCEGAEECTWCQEGYSWRWHGYLSALLADSLEHFLFEFTAIAANTFNNYHQLHQTLRACHFKAERPSGRHNGRVVIHCKPADEQRLRLPTPPDVKKILCHLWNVQNTTVSQHNAPDRVGDILKIAPGTKGNGRP